MLSRLLDFELNTFGLYIGKYNTKVCPDLVQRTITLVVTDVARCTSQIIRADSYAAAVRSKNERLRSRLATSLAR